MHAVEKIDAQIDKRLPQSPEAIRKRRNRVLIPLAAIATGATLFFGGKAAFEHFSDPTFSAETTTYTLDDGEGLLDAAAQIENLADDRDGVNYIESMPENQEALADGLDRGESIVIPISASK